MPRSSCIEHGKRARYVRIWEDYAELFDFNYCTAALLASFEFLCNGELDRMEEVGDDSDPWFICNIDEMSRNMIRMYSQRSIHYSLAELIRTGLVEVQKRGVGKYSRYLFRVDRVQEALRRRYIFTKDFPVPEWPSPSAMVADEDTSSTEAPSAVFADKVADDSLLLKEEEIEVIKTPIIPFGEISEEPEKTDEISSENADELTVDKIVKAIHYRCHWKGRQPKLGKKSTERITGRVVGMVRAIGIDRFVNQANAVLDDAPHVDITEVLNRISGDWGRREYARPARKPVAPRSESQTPDTSSRQAIAAPASQETKQGGSSYELVMGFVSGWNTFVPSCPVEWDPSQRYITDLVLEASSDGKFTQHFQVICENAEKIHKSKGAKASWLTFSWMLSTKEKGPNWRRLLSGEFNFMMVSDSPARGGEPTMAEALLAKLRKGKAAEV